MSCVLRDSPPCCRYQKGAPPSFWLPGFFFTPSFTTAVLQNYARARRLPIDSVQFAFEMLPPDAAAALDPPAEGVCVYGMHLEGCAWDAPARQLTESQPKVLTAEAPPVWLKPVTVDHVETYPHYSCPVYRTAERKGARRLLTTCIHRVSVTSRNVQPDAAAGYSCSLWHLWWWCS